jgi:hypothetical protein
MMTGNFTEPDCNNRNNDCHSTATMIVIARIHLQLQLEKETIAVTGEQTASKGQCTQTLCKTSSKTV